MSIATTCKQFLAGFLAAGCRDQHRLWLRPLNDKILHLQHANSTYGHFCARHASSRAAPAPHAAVTEYAGDRNLPGDRYNNNRTRTNNVSNSLRMKNKLITELINLDDEFIDEMAHESVAVIEEEEEEIIPHRQRPFFYDQQIRDFTKGNQLDKALEFFYIRMGKEDKVPPSQYTYFRLITACAVVGDLDRAFSLYNEMKTRHYILKKNDPRVISSLFNACAEHPYKAKAVAKARYLYERLIFENFTFDVSNYNAIMKVFARHGDLISAFGIADRMNEQDLHFNSITVQTLLSACLSDKKVGFKFAIETWRRARRRPKFRFDNLHYRILLRIVRECGVGDAEFSQHLIDNVSKTSLLQHNEQQQQQRLPQLTGGAMHRKNIQSNEKDVAFITSPSTSSSNHVSSTTPKMINLGNLAEQQQPASDVLVLKANLSGGSHDGDDNHGGGIMLNEVIPSNDLHTPKVPDILAARLRYDITLRLGNLTTSSNRLALLGGPEGFIERMKRLDDLKPDEPIFNELMQSIPSTSVAEDDLIALMQENEVAMSVDFYNQIITKRNKRDDFGGALVALQAMHSHFLTPNEQTFGAMAMFCKNETQARELLDAMQRCDVEPNEVIIGSLLSTALTLSKFTMAMLVMDIIEYQIGHASPRFVQRLDAYFDKHLRRIRKYEMLAPSEKRRLLQNQPQSRLDHIPPPKAEASDSNKIRPCPPAFLDKVYRFKQHYFMWLKRLQAKNVGVPWKYIESRLHDSNDDGGGEEFGNEGSDKRYFARENDYQHYSNYNDDAERGRGRQ